MEWKHAEVIRLTEDKTELQGRRLLGAPFESPEVARIFSDENLLRQMLRFERALLQSLIKKGIAPDAASEALNSFSNVQSLDIAKLASESKSSGNLAMPFVKNLTKLVEQQFPVAAKFVHWGATSQDVLDTALVLQIGAALALMIGSVERLCGELAQLTRTHRHTVLAGRTWLQQAPPVTMGFKAAGWLDAVVRHRERMRETATQAQILQFGGAVGNLAALGDRGLAVAESMAGDLGLQVPAIPWHASRDRIVQVGTTLGLLCGTLGKIARDISLLMQSEVQEAREPQEAGRGGSSTMPHKRNPVGCAAVIAAAIRIPNLVATLLAAMPQEHERGLGGWQAEWETLPEICVLAAGALEHMLEVIHGLEVDGARMEANFAANDGLIMAEAVTMRLAERTGKSQAHELVQSACQKSMQTGTPLREVLLADLRVGNCISAAEVDQLLYARKYLGESDKFIDRVLKQLERW